MKRRSGGGRFWYNTTMRTIILLGVCAAGLLGFAQGPLSGEDLARRQARSVHLRYDPTERNADAVRGVVTVTEVQTNSYYCLFGWDCGYCGIQDVNGRRVLIFSVWDPGDPMDFAAHPDQVAHDVRAKVLYAKEGVDVARFGGEGTGARTMTETGWKVGDHVAIQIEAKPDGEDRTAFTCRARNLKTGAWETLATVSTIRHETRACGINGIYSFVEDFWRNGHSATLSRRAEFSRIETRSPTTKKWLKAERAFFTGDGTPSLAIDAGLAPRGFFLQTGGATTNAQTRLNTWVKRDQTK